MENAEYQRLEKTRKMLDCSTFKELADKIGVSQQIFYDIKAGRHGISKKLAEAIHAYDDKISVAWLMTGDGDTMVVGDGNVTGNNNQVNTDTALVRAIDEIGEQRKLVAKSQEQIDRLLQIIEKLT